MDYRVKGLDLDELQEKISFYLGCPKEIRRICPDSEVVSIETDISSHYKIDEDELLDSILDLSDELTEGRLVNGVEVLLERFLEENSIRIKTYIWVQNH